MNIKLTFGLASILALGLAACGDTSGDNPDASYVPPQPDSALPTTYDVGGGAIDTTPAIDTSPVVADPYVWVVIQDTEQIACTTNGPGADIDAVALQDAQGSIRGYGKVGTAIYTPNSGVACTNAVCNGAVCKYAANGGVYTLADLQSRTEGPADATVSATTDDQGYFSLNAGTLQMNIGAVDGTGAALEIKSGDYIYVYEVDQYYVSTGAAYPTCTCPPENYTVYVQTAAGAFKPATPVLLDPNNTTCAPLTATSTEGCGTTTFVVP